MEIYQSIAGGRFTAVAAVLCQPIFQSLHPFSEKKEGLSHLIKQCNNCLFALLIDSMNFFVAWNLNGHHAFDFQTFRLPCQETFA